MDLTRLLVLLVTAVLVVAGVAAAVAAFGGLDVKGWAEAPLFERYGYSSPSAWEVFRSLPMMGTLLPVLVTGLGVTVLWVILRVMMRILGS